MMTPHEHELYKTAILDDERDLYQCSLCSYFIVKRVVMCDDIVNSDADIPDDVPAVNSHMADPL
jgi:hypothetical protein